MATGPLGQGVANAVGFAVAERHLATRFNRPDCPPLIDHWTYVVASDGDLQEGMTYEACSLAGQWGLDRLVLIYDENRISIDVRWSQGGLHGGAGPGPSRYAHRIPQGEVRITFNENVDERFEAMGWHVQHVPNASEDVEAVRRALQAARAGSASGKPHFIRVSWV